MKHSYVTIPYGNNATLRIRKDRIVATVSAPDSNNIDIYTADTVNPWHITEAQVDNIIFDIWDE